MEVTMRVYYPGPDRETYHPRLGRLDKDKVFELDDKTARLYIDGGLLCEAKPKPATKNLKPATRNPKPATEE
jgi:hypothetical protein